MLLGALESVQATSVSAPTGVDANTGILLGYASGAIALLDCNVRADSPWTASVTGTTGRIEVPSPFFRPDTMTLHRKGADPETFTADVRGYGFAPQEEVARCLRAAELESPGMPLDETVAIHSNLDTIFARLNRPGGAGFAGAPGALSTGG